LLTRESYLVTGATGGLGAIVCEQLVASGARVIATCRSREQLDVLAAKLGNVEVIVADLARLADVERLAREVGQIDVLVNNAGVGFGRDQLQREISHDGIELRFAVNYLAGFVLTERLLPLLERSAPARIVMVASLGQAALDFDDPLLESSYYEGRRAYAQSKLAQITYANDLAARLLATGITVNSLHPATFMPTKIVIDERGTSVDSLDRGVESTVRVAVDPELDTVTGHFFDREQETRAEAQAYDPTAQRALRELSEKLAGDFLQ